MNLQAFIGKRVKLVDIDGDVFFGLADIYHFDYDTASGTSSLTFLTDAGEYLDFEETEIASIECMDVPFRELAIAV